LTELIVRVRALNLPAASMAMSTAALGHALQISSGTYNLDALWWVAVAFGLCVFATLTHRSANAWSKWGVRLTSWMLAAGVLWNLRQLTTAIPGLYIPSERSLVPFYAGCMLIGALAISAQRG